MKQKFYFFFLLIIITTMTLSLIPTPVATTDVNNTISTTSITFFLEEGSSVDWNRANIVST